MMDFTAICQTIELLTNVLLILVTVYDAGRRHGQLEKALATRKTK